MDFEEKKKVLKEHYLARNVVGIVRLVSDIKSDPGFPQLHRSLLARGLISSASASLDEIASALLSIVRNEIDKSGELSIRATYFEIGEQLKRKFGPAIADTYIQAKMPDDFMTTIRDQQDHGDTSKLSDDLVEQYKNRLIGIEKSRMDIVNIIQPFSVIPIQNVINFATSFDELIQALRDNYKYLTVKSYIDSVKSIADSSTLPADDETEADEAITCSLFRHYIITGTEPHLETLVQFQIALVKLFQAIKKGALLSEEDHKRFWSTTVNLWHPAAAKELSPKAREIFTGLLDTLNSDKQLLRHKLANTFLEEYRCAEDQMKIRHRLIETELANTKEYLNRVKSGRKEVPLEKEEKVRVAVEKVVCLREVFKNSPRQEEASAARTDSELEQSALDISTVITPFQLSDWIKIYSIIYSNQSFLDQAEEEIELSIMRALISDLTSYHLIQNIAQLKFMIESSPIQEEEKISHFERFSDALKVRLHSLMDDVKQKERSLKSMIEELSFLNNKSIQFLVADTFKGFQRIVDAFNSTASDFFVNDKEAMLKESRALYNQICNQSLKGFGTRTTTKLSDLKDLDKPKEKRSWLSKIFS